MVGPRREGARPEDEAPDFPGSGLIRCRECARRANRRSPNLYGAGGGVPMPFPGRMCPTRSNETSSWAEGGALGINSSRWRATRVIGPVAGRDLAGKTPLGHQSPCFPSVGAPRAPHRAVSRR